MWSFGISLTRSLIQRVGLYELTESELDERSIIGNASQTDGLLEHWIVGIDAKPH